jgi:hypothetical protein
MQDIAKQVKPGTSRLDPLKLIGQIVEILKIEIRTLGTDQTLESAACLLFSLGLGILPEDTDWPEMMNKLVHLRLEPSSRRGRTPEPASDKDDATEGDGDRRTMSAPCVRRRHKTTAGDCGRQPRA